MENSWIRSFTLGWIVESRSLVMMIDAATGVPVITLPDHGNKVTDAAFSPDGNFLVVSTNGGVVKI